jgi:hypothetical protein
MYVLFVVNVDAEVLAGNAGPVESEVARQVLPVAGDAVDVNA